MPRFMVAFKVTTESHYEGEIEYEADTAEQAKELAENDHDRLTDTAFDNAIVDYNVEVGDATGGVET